MSNNWWANKLGQQAPQQAPYVPPSQLPPTTPQPPYYPPEVNQQSLPQSAAPAARCPGCGSGNYGGTFESRARCYDCGYPLQQSGSGVGKGVTGGPQASGPTQAAKQVEPGGFNPQTIIGHL